MSALGQMRERMRLEAPMRTADGAGGWQVGWRLVATVWAAVRRDARESLFAQAREAPAARYRLTIRRRADIALDWRLVWGTRIIAVRGWDLPPERPDLMTILGEEETP